MPLVGWAPDGQSEADQPPNQHMLHAREAETLSTISLSKSKLLSRQTSRSKMQEYLPKYNQISHLVQAGDLVKESSAAKLIYLEK